MLERLTPFTETELGPVQIQVQSDEELGFGGPSNLGEDIGPATP